MSKSNDLLVRRAELLFRTSLLSRALMSEVRELAEVDPNADTAKLVDRVIDVREIVEMWEDE